jgi:hypothetical protein
MRPITLFDKSFIQSLHIDEAAWFDHFFLTNICPIFYTETLADLKKEYRNRTPEQEVSGIAKKFPDANGFPCLHHHWLVVNNLLGVSVPMTGQIPAHGSLANVLGKSCHVHNEIPEADDFLRWANLIFSSAEQEYASQWREDVSSINLDEIAQAFKAIGINPKTCKSLAEAKEIAQRIVNPPGASIQLLKDNLDRIGVQREDVDAIIERWISQACKLFSEFAPYAAHVLTVEVFFHVACAAGLLACDTHSWLDICYLHYLPFCMVFVSSDKLHRRCAELFMRPDQQFVWGIDLKKDLLNLNLSYKQLPEEIRKKGMSFFAGVPPKDGSNLVSNIWDRHSPGWRLRDERSATSKAPIDILNRISEFSSATPLLREQVDFDPQDPDVLFIKRRVRRKKGSWWQVPSDM